LLKDIVLDPEGCDAAEFIVSYWKFDPGDRVSEGDELVVVESAEDKTAVAIVSPYSGTLAEVAVEEEETVRPGDLLGRIDV